jgi:beta-glucosidase
MWENQVETLLSELTLDEKISMLHGSGFFRTAGVERLGIPPLIMSDGPMGVRNEFPDDQWIPIGHSDDYVTYLPSNSAIAATWNPECAYASGQVLGEEARGRGKDVILAPGINIKRDPLCGRNFEYMSEDPYLISEMCVPLIKGIQESDVAACVKHFALNNQETDRLAVDTIVADQALQELYLPGFLAAVKKGEVYSLMNAYNKYRGAFCGENKELLNDILRDDWQYDGTVISDWGSIHSTVETVGSSMDIEMSVTTDFDDYYLANPLKEAVQKGEVDPRHIDAKVRNILRMMFRLKMIGEEAGDRKAGTYDTSDHQEKAYQTAKEAIVLLQNREQILPINKERLQPVSIMGDVGSSSTKEIQNANNINFADKMCAAGLSASVRKRKIAVIGQNANQMHAAGGGSGEIKALYEITPLLALKSRLGGNVDIRYAPGYYIAEKTKEEQNWQALSLERQVQEAQTEETDEVRTRRLQMEEKRRKLREEALSLARDADEVIFVGGLNHDFDSEGRDRANMKLPYEQDILIEALLAQNPNTVIVLIAGSPVEMPWRDRAKALLWSYYSGMNTGFALADVILGKVNPSGKLPETFPATYADTVTARNGQFGLTGKVEYLEGLYVGYRYYDKENVAPAFSFGHGLSYTTFQVDHLEVKQTAPMNSTSAKASDPIWDQPLAQVKFDICNTGDVYGGEIVQCYVTNSDCRLDRPNKELKAFQKIFLTPGESKTITLNLPLCTFSYYDEALHAFTYEPGRYHIQLGTSSQTILADAELKL